MVLDLNSSSYCLNKGGWAEGFKKKKKSLFVFLSLRKKRCESQPYFREAFEAMMDINLN